jgi:hypothetical protein
MIAISLPQYKTVNYGGYSKMIAANPDVCVYVNKPFENRRHGPAVALVGAFSTISAGFAIKGFLGGIMIAGGIFSGLGTLTGNKTLSSIGGVLSLAGGIGTAFQDAATGEFMNPFAEGASFSDTTMGSGFAKIKNFFSGESIGTSEAVESLNITGDKITESASTVNPSTIESSGVQVRDVDNNITSGSIPKGYGGSGGGGGSGGSSSGGLLSSLGGTKDVLNLASGAADGFFRNQEIEALEPVRDAQVNNLNANANSSNANTALLQNRYANMQNQPNVQIGVNPNAQVFNSSPGSTAEGKYAVVVNGEVKYVTQAEYAALKQQGGGLLANGAA